MASRSNRKLVVARKPNGEELRLNLKQRRFLKEYLKTGKISQSYFKVYGKHKNSHANIKSTMEKIKDFLPILYEKYGLSEKSIIKVVKEALEAKKYQVTKGQILETPDFDARFKAVAEIKEVLRPKEKEKVQNLSQTNIVILEDEKKNSFSVVEGDVV